MLLWWLIAHLGDGIVAGWVDITEIMSSAVTVVGTVSAWLFRRSRRVAEPLETVLDRLRRSVHSQWTQEFHTRGLFVPRPLRLRWRPTNRLGLGVDRSQVPHPPSTSDAPAVRVIDVRERAGDQGHPSYLRQLRARGAVLVEDLGGWRGLTARVGRLSRRATGSAEHSAEPPEVLVTDPARERLSGALVATGDRRPAADALVKVVQDESVRQLVLLGAPGAGKTTLALLFTLAALETDGPLDVAPVLLSPAGWDPRERLEDWTAQQIAHDYPGISSDEARRLIDEGKILPVLDGLDEMPPAWWPAAMTELERAAAAGLRMLVTCRTDQYAEIVQVSGVLPEADVVDVEPVDIEDAVVYLTQREPRDSTRWRAVTAAMRADPQGLLATALSTPLMISMARQVYQMPSTDPGELSRLPDADTVRQHLLGRFLPSVYGSQVRGAKAERWLVFLVSALAASPRDPNLLWWRLGKTVPRPVVTASVAVMVTLLDAVLCPLLVWLFDAGYGEVSLTTENFVVAAVAGGGFGLFLGVLIGRQAARSAYAVPRPSGPLWWLRALGTGAQDIVVAAVVLSSAGSGALLVLDLADPRAAARAAGVVIRVTGGLLRGDPGTVAGVASTLLVGAIVVTVAGGLGARQAGVPRRCSPRWRALLPSLGTGLGVGAAIGLLWPAVGLVHGDPTLSPTVGLFRVVMVAGAVGIPLGVGRWLSLPVTEQLTVRSPDSTLGSDRNALLLTSASITTITTLFLGFFLWYPDSPLPVVAISCVGIGANVFALVFLGSGAAWTSYTLARWWHAAHGRLPWRLTPFLRHAHTHGVLRQAGAAYQIRHDLLRAHLEAGQASSRSKRPLRGRLQGRLRSWKR